MHDPMVLAHSIPSPIPRRKQWREKDQRFLHVQWGWYRSRRTNVENLDEPVYPWWRPKGWHLRVAGREYGLDELVAIWHVEPRGADAFTVCGHDSHWKWHVHHWKIRVRPAQKLKRTLFERCELCGRGYPWGYAPFSHSWDLPDSRWFRIQRRAYHQECSSLVHARATISQDLEIIRGLVAYLRTVTDMSEDELVNHLCGYRATWAPFAVTYRLQGLLGYERDEKADDGTLVKKALVS